jgi:hypothetical protein
VGCQVCSSSTGHDDDDDDETEITDITDAVSLFRSRIANRESRPFSLILSSFF